MGEVLVWTRRRLAGLMVVGLSAALPAAGAPADAIVGNWLTDEGASKVEVAAAKGADGVTLYNGKLVWLKEPLRDGKPMLDQNNADAALHARPLIGVPILSGFKADAGGWSGGTVYAPRAGKSFPAELSLGADGRLALKVKAGLFSKTDYWTR